MMKKLNIYGFILALLTVFYACEPNEFDKSDLVVNTAPTTEEMNFTVTEGDDAFHFTFTDLTEVAGVYTSKWDFGNGATGEGAEVSAYYPTPGSYTVTLTITAADGTTGVKTTTLETTETDYAFFESEFLIALTGGSSAADGKTWVIDSTNAQHLGVGEAAAREPNWWSAQPLEKSGHYLYDDEFTFKMVGFAYEIDTHGSTQVNKDGNADDDGFAAGIYTGTIWEDDYDIDVYTDDAARGALTWGFTEEDGASYITISSQTGNISYDDGNARKYEVLEWNENFVYFRTVGGAARYHKLIPKGYSNPAVAFNLAVAETADENTWEVKLGDIVIPDGISVSGFTVDFGDGSDIVTVDGYTDGAQHTYMRKGTYPVAVTVMASNFDIDAASSITIENHHSSYEEFLLDMMVMYNDNSEVELAPMLGESCGVWVADNPDAIYPNKGSKVFAYKKEYQEWANAYMTLPAGYRFNLTTQSTFKMFVRGKAGQTVLLKLENTDRGGNAWQTGAELTYTIQADDTWEVAEYNFAGVGAGFDWTGDQFTSDITTDDRFNQDFYNVIRIMLNPGDNTDVYEFYFDDLAGPHVEGLKSSKL